jgi:hypothetical protein
MNRSTVYIIADVLNTCISSTNANGHFIPSHALNILPKRVEGVSIHFR